MVADTDPSEKPPELMKIIEDYVATALRAYAFALVGIFGANYYYQSGDATNDPVYSIVSWVGVRAIFLIALALNLWALTNANRELTSWARRGGFQSFIGTPILGVLIATTIVVTYHALGLIEDFPDWDLSP